MQSLRPNRARATTILTFVVSAALACGPPVAPGPDEGAVSEPSHASSVVDARSAAEDPSDAPAPPDASPAPTRREAERRSDLASIEAGQATQIYYQYVDRGGRVQFVSRLDQVPAEWRDRVGFVEMTSPPPGRPSDAQRLRGLSDEDLARRLARRPSNASPEDARGSVTVILYSAEWCGACRAAKQYMDERDIDYDERDVDDPDWHEEMVSKAGPGGIPVFDIEGEILRGFAPRRLEALIDRAAG